MNEASTYNAFEMQMLLFIFLNFRHIKQNIKKITIEIWTQQNIAKYNEQYKLNNTEAKRASKIARNKSFFFWLRHQRESIAKVD